MPVEQAPENASAPSSIQGLKSLGGDSNPRDRRELPRRFVLYRDIDETGISGTGIVAVGVQFRHTGKCFMEWVTPNTPPTWGVYDGMYALNQVHGHNGKTRILYPDDECTAACLIEQKEFDRNLRHVRVFQCGGDPGHRGDHGDPQTGIRWGNDSKGAIPPLELADNRFTMLQHRDQHLTDVYAALGVRWGEDPFTQIAKLRGYKDGVLP